MIATEEITAYIATIPSMPLVVTRILDICEKPDTSVTQIVEIIKLDPAITLKVLNLCNSSYYGLSKKVDSLQDAVVYIGLNSLVNLVLTSVASDFYRRSQGSYGLDQGELWKHSVAVAIASQLIGFYLKHEKPERLFTSGLLHDVGKTVLDVQMSNYVGQIRAKIQESGYTLLQAEEEVLGTTHCEVGLLVARHWELPPALCEVIQHHHEPLNSEAYALDCSICHLANGMVCTLGIGVGSSFGMANDMQAEALIVSQLPQQRLAKLSADFLERYNAAIDLVNISK